MNPDLRRLLKAAERAGATVTRRANNHYRIAIPGGPVVFTSSSPSDHRTLLNTRAALRRAGLHI